MENVHYGLEIAGGLFLVLLAILIFILVTEWAKEKWDTIQRASRNDEFKELYEKMKLRADELHRDLQAQLRENEALKATLEEGKPYR